MSDSIIANIDRPRPNAADRYASDAPASGFGRAAAIVGIATGLMGVGAMMTLSVGAPLDEPTIGQWQWSSPALRQLPFVISGTLAMLVMSRVPYRLWFIWRGRIALLSLLVALGLVAAVFVPGIGVEVNGALRWIQIPGTGIQFQPSELFKVVLPIFLAGWLAHRVNVRAFRRGLLPVVLVIGLAVGMVGLEDFGTAVLLAAVVGGMLLMAGAKWLHLILLAIPSASAFGYLLWSRPHRVERLMIFLDPWSDPEGRGYQVIQSLCTIASGGWWGRGLGAGFVKGYLPEARNDFVFAVICEELGMIGAAAVICLLIALMWQSRGVIRSCVDPAGRLLAFGIALTLGLQAAMNIGVVTASVPTKGISLPLVSAGGSGAIFLGALVGVLANIARPEESEK